MIKKQINGLDVDAKYGIRHLYIVIKENTYQENVKRD